MQSLSELRKKDFQCIISLRIIIFIFELELFPQVEFYCNDKCLILKAIDHEFKSKNRLLQNKLE